MTTGDSDSQSSNGSDSTISKSTDSQSTWSQSQTTTTTMSQNSSQPISETNGTRGGSSSSALIKPLMSKKLDMSSNTRIIQVANIAPQSTRDQMQALFGHVGKVEDLRLYPTIDLGMQHTSKICFVKFQENSSVGVAQHLTNTVFVDRALIVIPFMGSEIPDESKALELLSSGTLLPGIADPKLPQHVTSQLEGIPPSQVVVTKDPKLLEFQLPNYPNLPPTYDSRRIEEIRRTIMIANLDSDMTAHDVMEYFSNAGEIKYIRLCTRDNDPLHYALLEFTEQPSVLEALKFNGTKLGSKCIKVYHATQAIIKPQAKTNEAAQKEIEEAMSHQAQTLLTHGLDSASSSKDKRRSRSVSRGRHAGPRPRKSRSRSPRRRSRSPRRRKRSRSMSRSRSRSRGRGRRSRSRGRVRRSPGSPASRRRRSRSKDRKRSSSRTRRVKRSRSTSTSKRKDKKAKKDKERDRERNKDKERDSKENGVKKDDEQKSDMKEDDRDRDYKEKIKSPSKSSNRDRHSSPSYERKKSKSKKKKRNDSDREESLERRKSRSSSIDKMQLMD